MNDGTPTLRPYQLAASDAIEAGFFEQGQNRLLVKSGTGTGKTLWFASLLKRLAPWLETFKATGEQRGASMLVIAHREELLDQAADKITRANKGLIVTIEQGDRHASRYSDVVIASIQTLQAMKFKRLERLLKHHTFRIVIVDECFPAGTLVDGRPIEQVHVGDTVTAFDPATGAIRSCRVVRTLTKQTTRLVIITTGSGPLVCTTSHKLWTSRGWVRAGGIVTGDRIAHHATADHDSVSRLSVFGDVTDQESNRHLAAVGPHLLFRDAPEPVVSRAVIAPDGRDEPEMGVRSYDVQKSHAPASRQSEDANDAVGAETSAQRPRRQRAPDSADPVSARLGVGMAGRSRVANWLGLPASPLQTRYRERSAKDRDRSGRGESRQSGTAAAGQTERRLSAWARVDRVEVLEPGSDGRFERLCPDGAVYDLEVEDFHTYFANGFAVSNCHHAAAKSYRTALALLGFLPQADISEGQDIEAATHDDVVEMEQALAGWDAVAPKDRLLIGVTATPNRSDAVGLGCVFQSIAYSYALKDAIEDGWLTPIVPWVVETQTSLENVHMARGDFNQRELADAVNNNPRNQMALAAWREHADGLSTIGFTVDVQHAHTMADLFSQSGVRAVAISGETPKEERRLLLRQYTEGTVEVIFNCMVLTEGTDLPRTACILHLKPTSSATLYEQMTGRGLRVHPDDPAGPSRLEALRRGDRVLKPECIVIDLVDVARRHSLMAAPVLYGLPPSLLVKGQEMRQVEREMQALMEQHPGLKMDGVRLTLEQLRATASTFDIWHVASLGAFGAGRALNWIKAGEEDYRLVYPWADGTETLQVSKDMLGHYEVICTLRPRDGSGHVRQRTLATQVISADAAAGLAEAFVLQERRSTMKIVGKDEPWRKNPATSKQLGLLRVLGAPIKKGITAGEASTLITQFKARRVH